MHDKLKYCYRHGNRMYINKTESMLEVSASCLNYTTCVSYSFSKCLILYILYLWNRTVIFSWYDLNLQLKEKMF